MPHPDDTLQCEALYYILYTLPQLNIRTVQDYYFGLLCDASAYTCADDALYVASETLVVRRSIELACAVFYIVQE